MKRTHTQNKALYEAIMKDVAVIVKKHLNELSLTIVKKAQNKRDLYGQEEDSIYYEQDKNLEFIPQDKLTIYDKFYVDINVGKPGDNMTIEIYGEGFAMLGQIELGNDVIVNQSVQVYYKPNLNSFFENEIMEKRRCFKFFTRRDAIALSRLIKEETGIELSFRNFTTDTIQVPVCIANPRKFDARNYREDDFVEFKQNQR